MASPKVGRTSVEWNDEFFARVLNAPETIALLQRKADAVAAEAIATAPVDTGEYQASIHTEVVQHPSRTVVRVVADAPHAWVVEANTGNLARALDAAGGA